MGSLHRASRRLLAGIAVAAPLAALLAGHAGAAASPLRLPPRVDALGMLLRQARVRPRQRLGLAEPRRVEQRGPEGRPTAL